MSEKNGKAATKEAPEAVRQIVISPPKFRNLKVKLIGTAPYMQARFSKKAMDAMMDKMKAGSTAAKGKSRKPRDFDDDFEQAQHIAEDGWNGIPASAFRNACIDVCRMVGFKMTHAKMSIFIKAEGRDKIDGSPLVKIVGKKPERTELPVRNATGVMDIRVRPMWREWAVNLVVTFDGDQFTDSDVMNLLARAGIQVGVGEGRPFSRESNGIDYGTWRIASEGE
jgi:hypothetical protein